MGNVCLWCGGDCSFLATCPGLCLPCGDKMQALDKSDLILALAKAVGEVKALDEVRAAGGLAPSFTAGDRVRIKLPHVTSTRLAKLAGTLATFKVRISEGWAGVILDGDEDVDRNWFMIPLDHLEAAKDGGAER